MVAPRLRLAPKRQAWADRFKPKQLKGLPLRIAVSIEARYAQTLLRAIAMMENDTRAEIRKLFEANNYAGNYTGDANIGAQARIVMNGLQEKYRQMFARIAGPTTDTMIGQVDRNSASTLKTSLKDLSENVNFSTDILTGELNEMLSASAAESVALIKRVPANYLDQITGDVLRSIQTGNGLQDLQPKLEERGVAVRNWAQNIAMDQTRKCYNGLNKGRMEALGLNKYEWIHSGGSNHPRELHRDKLNGKIFSFDDPPVIDERTGERGIPGQAIFCRCTMRPIMSFEDDES